jgi:hypothetical protein
MKAIRRTAIFFIFLAATACQKKVSNNQDQVKDFKEGTFGYDVAFLKEHRETIEISAPDDAGAVAMVIPGYQGRVMTSTAGGPSGESYGWINYDLIKSGVHQPHMNAFGGEERLWLSPEGGQFSVYFKKGSTFDFENWQTPPLIDTVGYQVIDKTASSVSLQIDAQIENHSGTRFVIQINRMVSMLDKATILSTLDIPELGNCRSVAYASVNSVTNKGADWTEDKGVLGIWLLGMFRPSDKTVIVAPFTTQYEAKPQITDNYFGKIPSERIAVKDGTLFLKADGKFRSKIGIAPKSAKNVAGSYDAEKNVLTIIQFSLDRDQKYLKSTWEMHKDPYSGDALNAYNDGKLDDGTQMGPFYELESNSSVRALKSGEQIKHTQRTYHFEGDKDRLDLISKKVLGVSLAEIESVFEQPAR